MVEAPLRTPALPPLDRSAHDGLGEHQHVGDVANRVPAGVECAATRHADVRAPLAQREDRRQRPLQRLLAAPDPGVVLHRQLQVLVQLVRVLARCRAVGVPAERLEQVGLLGRDLRVVEDSRGPGGLRKLRRRLTGAPAEDEDVAERVAPETVRAMQATGHLAGGVQAGHGCGRGLRLDANAAHRVMDGRTHLHGLVRDVDGGERMELLVHRRQLAFHVVRAQVANVEVRAAVRRTATGLHLLVDRPRDNVARRQLLLDRVVVEHESRAFGVEEQAAFAAHGFGHQDAARTGRPDHARRVELHELHVEQVRSRLVRHGGTVAGALPGVGCVAVHPPPSSAREHDGSCLERRELSGVPVVAESAADPVAGLEQCRERVLHAYIDTVGVHHLVLTRADELETGAIADVGEALP